MIFSIVYYLVNLFITLLTLLIHSFIHFFLFICPFPHFLMALARAKVRKSCSYWYTLPDIVADMKTDYQHYLLLLKRRGFYQLKVSPTCSVETSAVFFLPPVTFSISEYTVFRKEKQNRRYKALIMKGR